MCYNQQCWSKSHRESVCVLVCICVRGRSRCYRWKTPHSQMEDPDIIQLGRGCRWCLALGMQYWERRILVICASVNLPSSIFQMIPCSKWLVQCSSLLIHHFCLKKAMTWLNKSMDYYFMSKLVWGAPCFEFGPNVFFPWMVFLPQVSKLFEVVPPILLAGGKVKHWSA